MPGPPKEAFKQDALPPTAPAPDVDAAATHGEETKICAPSTPSTADVSKHSDGEAQPASGKTSEVEAKGKQENANTKAAESQEPKQPDEVKRQGPTLSSEEAATKIQAVHRGNRDRATAKKDWADHQLTFALLLACYAGSAIVNPDGEFEGGETKNGEKESIAVH